MPRFVFVLVVNQCFHRGKLGGELWGSARSVENEGRRGLKIRRSSAGVLPASLPMSDPSWSEVLSMVIGQRMAEESSMCLGEFSNNVHFVRPIPHDWLLPRG